MGKGRRMSKPNNSDNRKCSQPCCNKKEDEVKSLSSTETRTENAVSDKQKTTSNDVAKKAKPRAKKKRTWCSRARAVFIRLFGPWTRKSAPLVRIQIIRIIIPMLALLTCTIPFAIFWPATEKQESFELNVREITWKGFVNDYLSHGIVEKLTLVNREWVEFRMTNDSNELVSKKQALQR